LSKLCLSRTGCIADGGEGNGFLPGAYIPAECRAERDNQRGLLPGSATGGGADNLKIKNFMYLHAEILK
jgi:hypothetical protein